MKTNKIFTHFALCLFSIFLIFLAVAQEQDESAESTSSEVSSVNNCVEGLVPIIKVGNSKLSCVRPEAAAKLIERGWGIAPIASIEATTETSPEISEEAVSETSIETENEALLENNVAVDVEPDKANPETNVNTNEENSEVNIDVTQADKVFLSGAVYTVDESNPWAEAVAIQDGKITYVGDDEGAQDFIGENTEITDLTGKMLLPGFHDTHAHPIDMSLTLMGCDLFEGTSKEEYLEQVEQCAQVQKDRRSLIGVGYWIGAFPEDDRPNRYDLDEISPDKPVWLMDLDGHSFWVNSKTLELSNIDKDTPDPEGGAIERDENGEPTGFTNW